MDIEFYTNRRELLDDWFMYGLIAYSDKSLMEEFIDDLNIIECRQGSMGGLYNQVMDRIFISLQPHAQLFPMVEMIPELVDTIQHEVLHYTVAHEYSEEIDPHTHEWLINKLME